MSRLYVGKRYVPKLMGEWDKKQQYESLSIVTTGDYSYTSKKEVPIGIEITNKEYWVITGNFNEQNSSVAKDVEIIKKDIIDLKEYDTENTKNIKELKEYKTSSSQEIANLKKDVQSLTLKLQASDARHTELLDLITVLVQPII